MGGFQNAVNEAADFIHGAEDIVLDSFEETFGSLFGLFFVNACTNNNLFRSNIGGKDCSHIGIRYRIDGNRDTDTGGGIGGRSVGHNDTISIMAGGDAHRTVSFNEDHFINLSQCRIGLNVQHHGSGNLDAAFGGFRLLAVLKGIANILGIHITVVVFHEAGEILCGLLVAVNELVSIAFLEQRCQRFRIVILLQLYVRTALTKEVVQTFVVIVRKFFFLIRVA